MEHNGFQHCPMCGMEFEKADTACAHGCPLGADCNLVRCPSCSHEFPRTPRSLSLLRRWFGPRRRKERCGWAVGLDALRSGERAELIRLNCESPSRRNTLTVFGLSPGVEVRLLQRRPSFVVQVGETELGLDEEIAGEILVRPIRAG